MHSEPPTHDLGAPPASAPPSPATGEQPVAADALFVAFVQHRDVQCPRCEYSLRNAMHATCPECGEPLRLTVGAVHPIMGALLATTAPGLGCGICGAIFATLIMIHPGAPGAIVIATFAMFLSGIVAMVVLARRRAFLRLRREHQRAWAIASIIVHSMLFFFLLVSFD